MGQELKDFAATWGNAAQWFSAIGTISAVTVAIAGDKIRRLFFKPKLNLLLTPGIPTWSYEMRRKADGFDKQELTVWYHARVLNPNRFLSIHKVQILWSKLEIKNAAGRFSTIWDGPPLPMHWRWQKQNESHKDVDKSEGCNIIKILDRKYLEINTSDSGLLHK